MTTISPSDPAGRDVALCRSLLYQALSLGFQAPTHATCERLGTADGAAALAEASNLLDVGRDATLRARTLALAARRDATRPEGLARSYERLFGHTARGTVPPYEVEYGDDTLFEKPQEMSDLAGFLRAFGLTLDASRRERIDHISCELEFLAFLARKEAHAIEIADVEMAAETRRAMRLFLKDHLGRFAPSFARRVMRADPDGFYGRLAALCLDFVTSECTRLEVPTGPEMLRLRLPIDDRAPIACGAAAGCAPGPCGPDDSGEGTADTDGGVGP